MMTKAMFIFSTLGDDMFGIWIDEFYFVLFQDLFLDPRQRGIIAQTELFS